MAVQKTDWGEIRWLDEDKEIFSIRGLQAGIVTLCAHAHQPKHIHYEEQVIYVIQGQAISSINGESCVLSQGGFFHWEAGVEHEIINMGNIPLQHLLISNPGVEEAQQVIQESRRKADISPDIIYVAVEAIRTQFLETLHYGYSIFDSLGNQILQSPYFPEYCVECCHPGNNPGSCSCMRQLKPKDWKRENIFQCELGMEVFHYPIYFGDVLLGYIQSGYIRHSTTQKGKIQMVYDVPESVVTGIKALLRRVVKAIQNYCEFEQFRKELMEKELCIASHEEAQRILIKNLTDTQHAMIDLKINNHFLFNTLNSMASMALDRGVMSLYQSIVDLSKMFHYTLRTKNSIVPLEKEIEYVRAYLQLQKLRYGGDLEVVYGIDQSLLKVWVPFNFLQPVVENAFIHGFHECIHKKIIIEVSKQQDRISIRVMNSGTVLSEQVCHSINQAIISTTSHGLSVIYQKLRAVYGDNCIFEISSLKNGNTCFSIQIPVLQNDAGEERI